MQGVIISYLAELKERRAAKAKQAPTAAAEEWPKAAAAKAAAAKAAVGKAAGAAPAASSAKAALAAAAGSDGGRRGLATWQRGLATSASTTTTTTAAPSPSIRPASDAAATSASVDTPASAAYTSSDTSSAAALAATHAWVEDLIIGLNLCTPNEIEPWPHTLPLSLHIALYRVCDSASGRIPPPPGPYTRAVRKRPHALRCHVSTAADVAR